MLVVAGCAAETEAPTPSRSVEIVTTPTPKPEWTSPAPIDPSVKPTVAELVVSPEGLGPIQIGQVLAERPAELAVALWDPTFCDLESGTDHGGWKPNYPLVEDGHYPFLPLTQSDSVTAPVTEIIVQSPEIRTAEGLGIGSSVADLSAAYGAALVFTQPEFAPSGYMVAGSAGNLIFWAGEGDPNVFIMTVQIASSDPHFYYEVGGCE